MTSRTNDAVERALQGLNDHSPDAAAQQVREMIDSNRPLVEASIIDERREKREAAKATVETLQARVISQDERLQEVNRKMEAIPMGHVLRAVLFLSGAAACIITEATLSLSLPFLLNLPEHSFLAWMMGLAVASAALMLEYVIEKLGFGVSPGELLRSAIPSRFWRVSACAVAIVSLLAVAGLNLYTISRLTPTREEAAKLLHNIESPDEPPMVVDEAKVSRAVFWFSVSATVGAALLLVVGASDARRLRQRGTLRVQAWLLSRERGRSVGELNMALAAMAARQGEWDCASADAKHAADLVRADHLHRLELTLLPKPRPDPSPLEVIENTFRACWRAKLSTR